MEFRGQPFEVSVPYSARAAQQRRIAAEALPYFNMGDAAYQLLKHGTTTTFRVVSRADQRYVLRLQPHSRMPLAVVQSEVCWLSDIAAHTPLRAPVPLPAINGDLTVLLPPTPEHEAQIATCFMWIPGRHKQRLCIRDAELIGENLATLHTYSSTYQPSATFQRWLFDSSTFLENAAVLTQVDPIMLSAAAIELVHTAIRFVQSMLTVLETESASYGLIHADTNLTNWLFDADTVALIDFEVCCYGYYIFDIGRLLHELARDENNGATLIKAFHRGYGQIRPLPPLADPRLQAGTLMSLVDIVTWTWTLEPWMHSAWAGKLAERAMTQIQQIMAHIQSDIPG